jgi:hypothetical protein
VKTRFYRDQDGDGFGDPGRSAEACSAPAGFVADRTDCDDGSADGHPGGTEVCNGRDDDCDGSSDEGVLGTFYRDADGDGHGNAGASTQACAAPAGYVANRTDCDDARRATRPGAAEACNGIDDNCNGTADEGVLPTFHADADGDGYGNAAAAVQACAAPAGHVADASDCDDGRPLVNPAAAERCNAIDDTCDGTVDEGCAATEVRSFGDDLAQLTALHEHCTPERAFSNNCYSAARRWCRAQSGFSVGGYGTIGYDGAGNYSIVCLNRNVAANVSFTFATLQTMNAGCTDNTTAWTLSCFQAMDLACQANGYLGGVGPVEHEGNGAAVVCVSRGRRLRAAPSVLAAYDAGCTSAAVAVSGACLNAYHRYCVEAGYASGFGPTAAGGGDGIHFVCVPGS